MLEGFVDLARLSASVQNLQPLKYFLSCEERTNEKIFSSLSWAGYLYDWEGPEEDERPDAYIVVLGDKSISENFSVDAGIAAQSIRLGAMEKGLGSCIIASCKKDILSSVLNIADHLEIIFVISLGIPGEEILFERVTDNADMRYWRDEAGVHHLPKRDLDEIII
jgi:nitroreductase